MTDSLLSGDDEVLAPLESIQELRGRLNPTNLRAAAEKDIVSNA